MASYEQEMKRRAENLVPVGYNERRLKPEADNPREAAFFEQWRREHQHHDTLRLIAACEPTNELYGFGHALKEVRELTEADRRLAATVIQWLGSNIGMSFIRMAMARFGYEIVPSKERKNG